MLAQRTAARGKVGPNVVRLIIKQPLETRQRTSSTWGNTRTHTHKPESWKVPGFKNYDIDAIALGVKNLNS